MNPPPPPTAEEARLAEAREGKAPWRLWGPYLSERQWGTVREDYSADGDAWRYLPHDHARSRAYRWGEDGIAGISDEAQRLCFALALWNGADPFLKERLFGLSGHEGNHGEDVKEYCFYVDNVPSHAYMKYLYKYPQRAFPYADLVAGNARRTRLDPEYELLDTGVFDDDRYFDVEVEYAKAGPTDVLVRVTATNRGAHAAPLHLLPTLWFRNDWSWKDGQPRPRIVVDREDARGTVLRAEHRSLPPYWLHCDAPGEVLFTENDTNGERLFGAANATPWVKDAMHACVVDGRRDAVNPARTGSKAAPHYALTIDAGAAATIRLRLTAGGVLADPFGLDEIVLNLATHVRGSTLSAGTLRLTTSAALLSQADCVAHPDARPGEYVLLSVAQVSDEPALPALAHLFEPLPATTGAAIAAYLEQERPKTRNRAVFVRHHTPRGEPVGPDLVRKAIRQAFARAGLPYTRSHLLRHTMANRLLAGGASLKEVADVLRHRSLNTTMIYAKLDSRKLTAVALPWPGSAA